MGPLTLFTHFLSYPSPQLALFPKRCLRSRLNTNQCRRCLESCPTGALSVINRKIDLDTAQCTHCMSCVAACPQDALVSDHDLDKLLSSFQTGGDVVVSCIRQEQNHPDEITLPCVGILSRQVLAAIFVSGCRSVTFNLAGCKKCCNKSISRGFMGDCRQMSEDLADIRSVKLALVEKREQLLIHRMDRRSYLKKIRDIATDVSKKNFILKPVGHNEEPKRNRRIPFKTQLIKKLITNVDEVSQKKIFCFFSHNLSVNADCNCCPLCKGICPTGAIKIDRTDQGKKIKFNIMDCSGCGLCVEFCRKKSISLDAVTSN